jgi:hypothetical protein
MRVLAVVLALLCFSFACDTTITAKKACSSNEQCDANGFVCVDGFCIQPKACATDKECVVGKEQCVNLQCLPSRPCSDGDCPGQQVCRSGYCYVPPFAEDSAALYVRFEPGDKKDQVLDSSQHKHHGTNKGIVSEKAGYQKQAGSFSSAATLASFAPASQLALKQLTVSAWVRLSSQAKGGNVIQYTDGQDRNGYGLGLTKERKLWFFVANEAGRQDCFGDKELPTDKWLHLAGSYDGITIRCFVNGKVVQSLPWEGPVTYDSADRTLRIGGQGPGQASDRPAFQGMIDEVLLFGQPRKADFLPGLKKYLYVASEDGKTILAIDANLDAYSETQSFASPVPGAWPVALRGDGARLYLWEPNKKTLHAVDVSTQKVVASTSLSGPDAATGAIASVHDDSGTLWLWGPTTSVLPVDFAQDASPTHVFGKDASDKMDAAFPGDVAYLPARGMFVATDTEKKSILSFVTKQPARGVLWDYAKDKTKFPGVRPTALAGLDNGDELRVAFDDSPELKQLIWDGGKFVEKSALTIQETFEDSSGQSLTEKRNILRMIGVTSTRRLYYTFSVERFIYQMDIQVNLQYRLDSWRDPTDLIQQKTYALKPFRSTYLMHMDHLGTKVYIQEGNTGTFFVLNMKSHTLVKSFTLPSKTMDKRLSIVGVQHPQRAY